MRKIKFAKNEHYHIYNRGTEKRKIFLDNFDYQRFLLSMRLMNDEQDGLMVRWRDFKITNPNVSLDSFLRLSLRKRKPLVDIVCFSLLPNHFHFILTPKLEKGIESFMHRLGVGYSMYFNKKYNRSGSLFQGTFKASQIKPNVLLYLSAYVNCNAEVHGIAKAENWRWSSYSDYVGKTKYGICNKKVIMDDFEGEEDYEKFARDNAMHMREKKLDEKVLLEAVASQD